MLQRRSLEFAILAQHEPDVESDGVDRFGEQRIHGTRSVDEQQLAEAGVAGRAGAQRENQCAAGVDGTSPFAQFARRRQIDRQARHFREQLDVRSQAQPGENRAQRNACGLVAKTKSQLRVRLASSTTLKRMIRAPAASSRSAGETRPANTPSCSDGWELFVGFGLVVTGIGWFRQLFFERTSGHVGVPSHRTGMYRLKGETSLQVITTGVVCRDFIGRRHELDFLIEQALQARPGRGSTLIVQGDAGIGKTRLIAEFADIARTHGIVPAIGNCYEFGDPPYAPLLEIAEILGADDAAAALQAQAVDGDARSGRERTRRFAAFAAGLAAIAKTKTVVAVIENLHWADIATLELFRSLSGALKAHPCVLVATLRPEDIGTSGRATTALRAEIERAADATITLQALGPAEMRALLASALRDDGRHVSSTVLEKIAELSDGRPFHAEELLRGMLDYRGTAADAAAAIIPRSLGAAVHDRLASLDESAREILAFAAVIGRRFGAQFLAEFAAKPLAEVLLTLRRARNLQLIVEDPDGDAFFFRHQLTREVVYAEILFAEARTLHRRIVEELAAQAEPDAATVTSPCMAIGRSARNGAMERSCR